MIGCGQIKQWKAVSTVHVFKNDWMRSNKAVGSGVHCTGIQEWLNAVNKAVGSGVHCTGIQEWLNAVNKAVGSGVHCTGIQEWLDMGADYLFNFSIRLLSRWRRRARKALRRCAPPLRNFAQAALEQCRSNIEDMFFKTSWGRTSTCFLLVQ